MSTVNEIELNPIEIPEKEILKQEIAFPLLTHILAYNQKRNNFHFKDEKLTIIFYYQIKIYDIDFDYFVETKYVFENKNEFIFFFKLIEFKIVDNKTVHREDKYFVLTHKEGSTELPHASVYFASLLNGNQRTALKVAEEFFDNHDGTNTLTLIEQLKAKY